MMEMLLPCMTWVPLIWDQLRALFISFNTIHDTRLLNDGFVQCDTFSGDDFPDLGKNHGKGYNTIDDTHFLDDDFVQYNAFTGDQLPSKGNTHGKGDNNSPSSKEQSTNNSVVPSGPENKVVEQDPSSTALSSLLDIPDDIILNVLSRLSNECVLRCLRVCKTFSSLLSNPVFVAMHLGRATPMLVVQSSREYDESDFDARVNILQFIDQNKVIVATRRYNRPNEYKRMLLGSYNGLLLFKNPAKAISNPAFFIWNPITHEEVSVMAPCPRYCVCGMFFDTPTKEYRLLYICHGMIQSKYLILGLRSKLSREVAKRTEVICMDSFPSIINGALHWMVSEDRSTGVLKTPPSCSKSIMIFKIESEEFFTMPHPGEECCLKKGHRQMQLLEMDGQLCLFNTISSSKGYLWVLQNYKKQVWVKTHTINIEPVIVDHILYEMKMNQPWLDLKALYIDHYELLLQWRCWEFIYYHLKLNTFRKGERGRFEDRTFASVVVHVTSFVSVHADSLIFLEDLY